MKLSIIFASKYVVRKIEEIVSVILVYERETHSNEVT